MNSLEVFENIQKSNSMSANSTLINHIYQLLNNVKNWILKYISKENNREIDQMAKLKQLLTGKKGCNYS